MTLSIGFTDIFNIYKSTNISIFRTAVYSVSIVTCLIITLVRFAKQLEQNATEQSNDFRTKIVRLLKPLLPYFLFLGILPFLLTGIEYVISEALDVESIKSFTEITEFDKSLDVKFRFIIKKKLDFSIFSFINPVAGLIPSSNGMEVFMFGAIKYISAYLFSFALGFYFLWLLGLEIFAPFAMLGFVFKELRGYTDKWISNLIACKAYLILIFLSNIISTGFYKLYNDEMGGHFSMIVGIVFILFRIFLYGAAKNVASKLI